MKRIILLVFLVLISCKSNSYYLKDANKVIAQLILGNPNYQSVCYGGFREKTRDVEPTIPEIIEDLRILSAMSIKVLRTYNVHNKEVSNLLKAIRTLKKEDSNFEMYVMLGAWIECKNAFTKLTPIHTLESERNAVEIKEVVRLANAYPDIIKIIAVGNEAMVKWQAGYYVEPAVILKWVNHLQNLKRDGKLSENLWITSSDNFASWGGGSEDYHVEDLNKLMKAVDYISMHTYPMHDTHYNPNFWGLLDKEQQLSEKEKIDAAMGRGRDYAIAQYNSVSKYMKSLGVQKPIHIGETGWASISNEFYGNEGSKATDEYKAAQYYKLIKEWANKEGVALFYFEAFDEQWKDSENPMGSENHFGFINLQGQAKYSLWEMLDKGVFDGLTRDGKPITKTYNGNESSLWMDVKMPAKLINN
jgi:exo-beta-1,3-glucanase (GH17 family)